MTFGGRGGNMTVDMAKIEEAKIYEIGYLLVPYLPDTEVSGVVAKLIKDRIVALGGEVTSAVEPTLVRLSYSITKIIDNKHVKFTDGYFGALRFKVLAETAVALDSQWLKDNNIIRHLVIVLPTGSENISAPKRSFTPRREEQTFEIERVAPEKVESVKPVLSAEELDKEIDKLAV